jgi:hypothetical protein
VAVSPSGDGLTDSEQNRAGTGPHANRTAGASLQPAATWPLRGRTAHLMGLQMGGPKEAP